MSSKRRTDLINKQVNGVYYTCDEDKMKKAVKIMEDIEAFNKLKEEYRLLSRAYMSLLGEHITLLTKPSMWAIIKEWFIRNKRK